MEIKRSGSQPSAKGPADYFTGTVRIDAPFAGEDPARVGGATVTFEPGARTAWHTHPLGQTLIVTSGLGWVQREGGPVEEIRPGDIVWFAPGEKHWHGASLHHGHDAHRHRREAQRQPRRLDGESHRRTVPAQSRRAAINLDIQEQTKCLARFCTARGMCVARRFPNRKSSSRPTPSSACRRPASAALTFGPSVA